MCGDKYPCLRPFSLVYGVEIDVYETKNGVVPCGRMDHIIQLVHLIIEAYGTQLLKPDDFTGWFRIQDRGEPCEIVTAVMYNVFTFSS